MKIENDSYATGRFFGRCMDANTIKIDYLKKKYIPRSKATASRAGPIKETYQLTSVSKKWNINYEIHRVKKITRNRNRSKELRTSYVWNENRHLTFPRSK